MSFLHGRCLGGGKISVDVKTTQAEDDKATHIKGGEGMMIQFSTDSVSCRSAEEL